LPLILLSAVVQGWALYGLHRAIEDHRWPATNQAWLIALYALAVFVPTTLQLLAEHSREAGFRRVVAAFAISYFYFGWHYGARVSPAEAIPMDGPRYFSLALLLTVLWLLALPFAQGRLATGSWTTRYRLLFTNGWRNQLMLAEAALFTGLFWLLLFLWQTLFHMLGIDYFRELFKEPVFIYPVTSLTFGCALHLIGSIDRLTSVVLEQILSVLKWLAILAGVILVFFTVALVFKLPGLLFTGSRAIGATWLLWLIAVIVLLLNAAYRDGSATDPYPKWVARFLKGMVPLTVIIAATALYALGVRTQHYGLTVERVWAFVVAGAALCYSIGYSISAFGTGAWLGGIARVNVAVALALIVVISAALTPALSPYRLAANSQARLVQEKGVDAGEDNARERFPYGRNSIHYLRFDTGDYGRAKLRALAQLQSGPHAEEIRREATAVLAQTNPWERLPRADVRAGVSKLRVYPNGRTLDPALIGALAADFHDSPNDAAGIFIDLNGDGTDEFVVLGTYTGLLYQHDAGRWVLAGHMIPRAGGMSRADFERRVIGELAVGHVSTAPSKWNELSIGDVKLRVNPND
jgi:hypothetical protein